MLLLGARYHIQILCRTFFKTGQGSRNFFFKPNKKIKLEDYAKSVNKKQCSKRMGATDYLVKEAEMVITNYISTIEHNKKIKYIEANFILLLLFIFS